MTTSDPTEADLTPAQADEAPPVPDDPNYDPANDTRRDREVSLCADGGPELSDDPATDELYDEFGADEVDAAGDGWQPALPADAPDTAAPSPSTLSGIRGLIDAEQPAGKAKVAPMKGPHIQAAGYSSGRDGMNVRVLVVHAAEGATDEVSLGNYFHGNPAGSSNAGIGQDGGYATYVGYGDCPWTNPPLNDVSDTLEICGFSAWSRGTWLSHPRMLDKVAYWLAWRAGVRQIPLRRLVGDALRSKHGVTAHIDINNVYHESSHWDCGPAFPWDHVMKQAGVYANVGSVMPYPDPDPGGPTTTYTVKSGDTLARIGRQFRCYIAAIKALNNIGDHEAIRVGQKLKVYDNRYRVHLKDLVKAAKTAAAAPGVRTVENALASERLLPDGDKRGVYGPLTRDAYRKWQVRCGYSGRDADGIPGKTTLSPLGRRHGFDVTTK